MKKGALAADQKDATLGRLATAPTLDGSGAGAELVVEAATEHRETKFQIFRDLDRVGAAGGDSRHQHVVDLDYRDRGADRRARGSSSGCTS